MNKHRAVGAACWILVSAWAVLPLGCGGANEDYVVISPPSESRSAEPSIEERFRENAAQAFRACLEQNASSLSERSYALRYDVQLNDRGDVVDSRLRTSNLQNTDAQGCISRVIAAMSVPDEAIQMRSRPVSGGERMMREQRATLNSESENPLVFLAPWVIEAVGIDMIVQVGVGIIAAIGTIATSPKRDECQERYMDCLMTDKGSQWGSVPKHSVCLWCRDSCKGNGGVWPASVPGMGKRPISCEY